MPRADYIRLVAALHRTQRTGRTAGIAARLRAGAADGCAEGFVAVIDRCNGAAADGSFHPRLARQRRKSE